VASIDPAALTLIAQTPATLRALLSGLPSSLLTAPNDEGWSLKDIVAHLHDVERVAFSERIERLLREPRPFIHSIDPPARLIAGGYATRDLDQLLDELHQRRAEHAAWLSGLSAAELERRGEHDTAGEIRVIDIAHQWAAHDMAHLRQIALMIQQYLAPKMGNTRTFYDV
jgi:hypothetical protein